MGIFYSKSTRGFYDSDIHGNELPPDVVPISVEERSELLQGEAEGKVITADEQGYPILIEPPLTTPHGPRQVTRAQGKAVLIEAGLWDAVASYVDDIADPVQKALALVSLNDTTHWRRDSPFLNAVAADLGITGERLDDLFEQAALIQF